TVPLRSSWSPPGLRSWCPLDCDALRAQRNAQPLLHARPPSLDADLLAEEQALLDDGDLLQHGDDGRVALHARLRRLGDELADRHAVDLHRLGGLDRVDVDLLGLDGLVDTDALADVSRLAERDTLLDHGDHDLSVARHPLPPR